MKRIFVTRKIPENGIIMLRDKGFQVDVSDLPRPMTQDELIARLKSAPYDAVLSLLNDKIDSRVFDAAPTVKIFANFTVGFDNFDIDEAKKRGIMLTNVPSGGTDRVAEHAWALLMALACRICEGHKYVVEGNYTGWDPMLFMGARVTGKVLGLIGAGRIGSEVARIASKGFGMRVAYYDIVRNAKIESLHAATFWPSVEDVLRQSDFVSLHVPLNDSTRHLMNPSRLKMMKPSAFLINTSRGPVVDEAALVEALRNRTIAGAGLDVFENEPKLASGLADLPNVVLTPHIASSIPEAREEMSHTAAINIIDALEGRKPRDLVYN